MIALKLERKLRELDKELYGYYKVKHCGNCTHCEQAPDKHYKHCKCLLNDEQVSWFKLGCNNFVNKHQAFINHMEESYENNR